MPLHDLLATLACATLIAGGAMAFSEGGGDEAPSHVEPIEGSALHRVILSEHAAARIGIATGTVTERDISRSHRVLGKIVAPPYPEALAQILADGTGVPPSIVNVPLGTLPAPAALTPILASGTGVLPTIVRVPFVARAGLLGPDHAAAVRQIGKAGESGYRAARLLAVVEAATPDAPDDLFFALDSTGPLIPAQESVLVEFSTTEPKRRTIDDKALFYDETGATWVYLNPEPLVFVRHQVVVDFLQEDLVVLTEGPPVGTVVVTVGVMLLFGTEFGMGH